MTCAACRARLTRRSRYGRLEAIWHEVQTGSTHPGRAGLERLLVRLGVGEATARLVAATPTLRGPGCCAVAGHSRSRLGRRRRAPPADVLFVVRPLGPLAGVAVAFAGGLDPTREIGLAAPYSGLRLLLIRTAAVLAVTAPIVATAGSCSPAPTGRPPPGCCPPPGSPAPRWR